MTDIQATILSQRGGVIPVGRAGFIMNPPANIMGDRRPTDLDKLAEELDPLAVRQLVTTVDRRSVYVVQRRDVHCECYVRSPEKMSERRNIKTAWLARFTVERDAK